MEVDLFMNNILLIFFAIPVATIILSAILETFIRCPIKVAGIFFSIFLVLAFVFGGTAVLLVAAIIYTVISFITAYIVNIFMRNCECDDRCFCDKRNRCNRRRRCDENCDNDNVFDNSSVYYNGYTSGTLSLSNNDNNGNNLCGCRRNR